MMAPRSSQSGLTDCFKMIQEAVVTARLKRGVGGAIMINASDFGLDRVLELAPAHYDDLAIVNCHDAD